MAGNRFRPSGWTAAVYGSVTGMASSGNGGSAVGSMLSRAARGGVGFLISPAGERFLHRVGYRRVIAVLTAAVAATALVVGGSIATTLFAAPATVPVSIAATVLGQAAGVFGNGAAGGKPGDDRLTGQQLAALSGSDPVRCTAATATAPPSANVSVDGQPAPAPGATEKIRLLDGGGISRYDAATVVDPVPPGTGALRANVWFLYRLAGMGDWDTFTKVYSDGALRDDDRSPDAVLSQVQKLNRRGVRIEEYRRVAAALSLAGLVTGRLTAPYADFRRVLDVELVSGCTGDSAGAARASAPPPSVEQAPPPEPVEITEHPVPAQKART